MRYDIEVNTIITEKKRNSISVAAFDLKFCM